MLAADDDALLASVMRKLLGDSGAYVDVWATLNPSVSSTVLVDGEAAVTYEEALACDEVVRRARR